MTVPGWELPHDPQERLAAIQRVMDTLAEAAVDHPRLVLQALPGLVPDLESLPDRRAALWACQLQAQSHRLLDELDEAVEVAEAAILEAGDEHPQIAAALHADAAIALNQKGDPRAAIIHGRSAAALSEQINDPQGQAWALLTVADALCVIGQPADAEPVAERARALCEVAGDAVSGRRARKQQAVVHRHLGNPAEGMKILQALLDEAGPDHARANILLEYGNQLTMSQDFSADADAFVEAAVLYAEHGDNLGTANAHRALATNELLLGRLASGRQHLDIAVVKFECMGSRPGLGYTLQQRALLRLQDGDPAGATDDTRRARDVFTQAGDLLGLITAARTSARIAHVAGDHETCRRDVNEAFSLARKAGVPLGVAAAVIMRAETDPDPAIRHEAGCEAQALYAGIDMPLGAAHAAAFAAIAANELGEHGAARRHIRAGADLYRDARLRVLDSGNRADLEQTGRAIPARLLQACSDIGQDAADVAVDVLVDDAPIGLRQALDSVRVREELRALATRLGDGRPTGRDRTIVARRLAAAATTLTRAEPVHRTTASELRAAHPAATMLFIGAPTGLGTVPVVSWFPEQAPILEMRPLTGPVVEDIARLHDTGFDQHRTLWQDTAWTHRIAQDLIPEHLHTRPATTAGELLVLHTHQTLSHVPWEALDLGREPLGVKYAVVRLIAPVRTPRPAAHHDRVVAYFDPGLDWEPEREAVAARVTSTIVDTPTGFHPSSALPRSRSPPPTERPDRV